MGADPVDLSDLKEEENSGINPQLSLDSLATQKYPLTNEINSNCTTDTLNTS